MRVLCFISWGIPFSSNTQTKAQALRDFLSEQSRKAWVFSIGGEIIRTNEYGMHKVLGVRGERETEQPQLVAQIGGVSLRSLLASPMALL